MADDVHPISPLSALWIIRQQQIVAMGAAAKVGVFMEDTVGGAKRLWMRIPSGQVVYDATLDPEYWDAELDAMILKLKRRLRRTQRERLKVL